MKTAHGVRRMHVIVLESGSGLADRVRRVSAELDAQPHVAPGGEALRELLDPPGAGVRTRPVEMDVSPVVVLDDQAGADATEALPGEILRLRPSLKVVYGTDRLDAVRDVEA